ncbi:DNA glycosylase [Thelephora ganbajun]|uniref:DNA glycosylase n=1 Tax=Thelephora ganbajun TaxID=370292 RepID=A0ACB6ZV26_THEGA|nr:DNA glycosylase [Thelephora ganbajun]
MPVTRSRSKAAAAGADRQPVPKPPKSGRRGKVTLDEVVEPAVENLVPSNESRPGKLPVSAANVQPVGTVAVPSDPSPPPILVPAELPFSFEEAKQYLTKADTRFQDVFATVVCTPYQKLDRVEPFRTLCTTILGQQISWMAARSICHRFVRLYNSSMPEKPTEESMAEMKSVDAFFPSPQQVVGTDIATLRTAGLSARKAEYVQDLAAHFADGRLSTEKLLAAKDEELYTMLTSVRGIGRVTVDMFAIFSLRRSNILPVGDLGVQRGLCLWYLSLHSDKHPITVSSDKKKTPAKPKSAKKGKKIVPNEANGGMEGGDDSDNNDTGISGSGDPAGTVTNIPPPLTPPVTEILKTKPLSQPPPGLPDGLSVATLKSRLSGKKVKGALLTPSEMEELTETWKPYRSLGVYYMWSVATAEE